MEKAEKVSFIRFDLDIFCAEKGDSKQINIVK